jgi:hypothetical protein
MTLPDYIALLPSQHKDKPNFVAWLTAILSPLIDEQNINWVDEYDIDTATGVSLDYIGEWIGQSRSLKLPDTFGGTIELLTDVDYRQVLKIKSALNRWDGTTENIYNAVREVFGYNFVWIEDKQNMHHNVVMDVQTFIENQAMLMAAIYKKAKPVGVMIDEFSFANRGTEYFGMANSSTIYVTVYPL